MNVIGRITSKNSDSYSVEQGPVWPLLIRFVHLSVFTHTLMTSVTKIHKSLEEESYFWLKFHREEKREESANSPKKTNITSSCVQFKKKYVDGQYPLVLDFNRFSSLEIFISYDLVMKWITISLKHLNCT